MPRETWAGLLTLGDIQSYDSLVCHPTAFTSVRGNSHCCLFPVRFFFFLNYRGSPHVECINEQKPTSSSVNNMENSHGNIVVNGLQQLTVLWGDFYLHL